MEYRDVKLKIVLDVSDAAGRADNLATPQPSNPGGPSLPGAPAPDAGAGAGRDSALFESETMSPFSADFSFASPAQTTAPGPLPPAAVSQVAAQVTPQIVAQVTPVVINQITNNVTNNVHKGTGGGSVAGGGGGNYQTAFGFASAAAGGSLSASVIGAVPFGGLVTKGIEYGPAVGAALERALPAPMQPFAAAARQAAEGSARALGSARAALDAGGEALDATSEIARAEALLTGDVNVPFLARYAAVRYDIARQLKEAEEFRKIYGREKMGSAAGGVIDDLAQRLSAGLGFSVGR